MTRHSLLFAALIAAGVRELGGVVCPAFMGLSARGSGDSPVRFAEGGGLKDRRLARKSEISQVLISRTLSVCGEVAFHRRGAALARELRWAASRRRISSSGRTSAPKSRLGDSVAHRQTARCCNADAICSTRKRFFFTARPPGPTARLCRDTRSHFELRNRQSLGLTVPPSRNGDHHIKQKDEEWDHRRLNTEW